MRNLTNTLQELIGPNSSINTASLSGCINAPMNGRTYRLEHQCQTGITNVGLGSANGFGGDEIYSNITITKIR